MKKEVWKKVCETYLRSNCILRCWKEYINWKRKEFWQNANIMDVIKYWSNALVFTWRQHESIEIYKMKRWETVRERQSVFFVFAIRVFSHFGIFLCRLFLTHLENVFDFKLTEGFWIMWSLICILQACDNMKSRAIKKRPHFWVLGWLYFKNFYHGNFCKNLQWEEVKT